MGRRVLITGLASFWGGRLALAIEKDPSVDVIVGLDAEVPTVPLERTEFVRTDQHYSILARIVKATQVDTILHTFLVVDSTRTSGRRLHEINVIGTMNLLAAASAPGSSVRQIVVKSSGLVYGSSWQDPAWFREEMPRVHAARSRVERSLVEVESYLHDFAEDNPDVLVSVLRFSNVVGTDIVTPLTKALQMPVVPSIFGFDPLVQFVEEDDVIRAIEFVMHNEIPGIFNIAGDGRLPWSEVAAICGKKLAPMPPVLTGAAAAPLGLLGLELPPEQLDLLRYGRGIDNRRLKQTGFRYRYTSAGAVANFAEAMRLRRTVGSPHPEYRYDQDVEAFFRHSPAVVRETRAVSTVSVVVKDRVGVVTVDDAPRRNALTLTMVDELVAAFDRLESDGAVGAIVVTGAPPAFCAGADLSHLGERPEGTGMRTIYEGFLRVARSPLPTVAAVNGAAVGAGMNLALCCDLRVAGHRAKFDSRFLQLGLHPGGGHTWMLDRALGPQGAAALVLFGEVLDGPAAAACGLAWKCVDDDELLDAACAIAARAAAGPPGLSRRVKATLREVAAAPSHDAAVDLELDAQLWSMAQPDFAERLAAMRQRISKKS